VFECDELPDEEPELPDEELPEDDGAEPGFVT